jgi:alternate signal-mediated exported protein
MNISKNKIIGFLAGTTALALIAGSWAFYTSTNSVDNKLQTKQYGDTLVEEFTPDTDWQPGETADKKVGVKNTGDYNLVVRVKLAETWTRGGTAIAGINPTDAAGMDNITTVSQVSATDGLTAGDKTVVEKTMASSGWTKGTDGYWYYNTQLAPGTSTSNLLTAIKLTETADMGSYTTVKYYHEGTSAPSFEPGAAGDTGVAAAGWQIYTGAVPSPAVSTNKIFTRSVSKLDTDAAGYSGADYDLTITSETCQATAAAVAASWTTAPANVVTGWSLS